MKVIIAGSRTATYQATLNAAYKTPLLFTEVVSGGAKGADTFGECFANKEEIPIKRFLPNWDVHGKKAGMLRNIEMGDYADALIAVWDGKSRGTKHIIDYMTKLNKPVYVYEA